MLAAGSMGKKTQSQSLGSLPFAAQISEQNNHKKESLLNLSAHKDMDKLSLTHCWSECKSIRTG